jgi:hypothetical protein
MAAASAELVDRSAKELVDIAMCIIPARSGDRSFGDDKHVEASWPRLCRGKD